MGIYAPLSRDEFLERHAEIAAIHPDGALCIAHMVEEHEMLCRYLANIPMTATMIIALRREDAALRRAMFAHPVPCGQQSADTDSATPPPDV